MFARRSMQASTSSADVTTMQASITGFALNPCTAVLPTCSTLSAMSPTAGQTYVRTRSKIPGHSGSYATTCTLSISAYCIDSELHRSEKSTKLGRDRSMKNWVRHIRGGIGIALTWAAGWMPIGALTALSLWVIVKPSVVTVGGQVAGLGGFMAASALIFGALGFVAGGIFSAVLRITEGRRTFEELTLPRFAMWGGIAGLLLGGGAALTTFAGAGLQLIPDAIASVVATLLGAGSAAGSLAIARKAGQDITLPTVRGASQSRNLENLQPM